MIITLCGSARFEKHFKAWNELLTLSGHTVFSLSVYPSDKEAGKDWYTDEEKQILDIAHKKKIRVSDAILVLNHCAYVGDSTISEIEFARILEKPIYCLESWGKGNGISDMHTQDKKNIASGYGVLNKGSKLDTFSPHMVGWQDLLPPAGSFRGSLINKFREFI